MLYLNIDVMNLTGFQPYGIEILTHRQGFGDQKLVWIYSNCWNYSSRIGHQNSQDKRHANPNHFRSPKLDQPWWTNWKWENFMIAWIMTMISNNIAKAKFSAFSLHFHQTIFARLSIYRLKSVDRSKCGTDQRKTEASQLKSSLDIRTRMHVARRSVSEIYSSDEFSSSFWMV